MGAAAYLKNWTAENLVRRTPGLYGRLMGLVRRSEAMSLDERRSLRDELTRRMLDKARTTPYARAAGLTGGYERWPLLEKETLRQDPGSVRHGRSFLPYRIDGWNDRSAHHAPAVARIGRL